MDCSNLYWRPTKVLYALCLGPGTDDIVINFNAKSKCNATERDEEKIVDENNKAIVAQGIVRDITDEERKARIIDEQKRQLEFIVNNSPLGIALTTDGIIEKCNASFTRILGYPEDRIIGKDLKSITIAAEQSDYEEKRKDLHKGAFDSFVTTQKYITSSGQIITTKINVRALPAGTYVCVLTSSGRYSEVVVTETVGVSPSPLKITFTTWAANP
mgnify:CR=1 FL=1